MNNWVYFERNTYFETMGAGINNANIKYLRYKVVGSDKILQALETGDIDIGSPQATADNISTIKNVSHLFYKQYTTNGYGYVGINPKFVPDIEVRQAIMWELECLKGKQGMLDIKNPKSFTKFVIPNNIHSPMKTLTRILALALVVIFAACGTPETAHYKVISYNIRVLTPHDTDSLHWDIRKPATITMIEQEQPDIFGLQESFLEQTRYVEAECQQYVRIGVGENDEDPASEVNAIFYLRDKFELLEKKSIWLSETPDTCSRGWDADYNRMATFVTLRDKNNGKELTYINTHFDHVGRVARIESAKMIAERIKSLQAAGKKAIIGSLEKASEAINGMSGTVIKS